MNNCELELLMAVKEILFGLGVFGLCAGWLYGMYRITKDL